MATRPTKLADMLRDAIRASDMNLNQITLKAGLRYSATWRLMNNPAKEPTTRTVDALLKALGLRIKLERKGR